jgi:hypothetical protein
MSTKGNKFLLINKQPRAKDAKTDTFNIQSVNGNSVLGTIKWYSHWRRYCFFPTEYTIFDSKCLKEITEFIDEQMNLRKK